MQKSLTILSLLLITAFSAKAQHSASQDTVLKGSSIEVIQSYKPQVKQAPKPKLVPTLPPVDTTHPVFNYDVPQQTLNYTYSSAPLRPLALGKDTARSPFPNYIKAGGGNISTIYLDAGIGEFQGADYESSIHLHHISQKSDLQYQQSSLSGIEAEGTLHKHGNDWHAGIDAERNQYNYYGYNHDLNTYSKDSTRQTYASIKAVIDMNHDADAADKVSYHPLLFGSLYTAKYNIRETSLGVAAPFTYNLDTSLQAEASLNGTLTELNTSAFTIPNNFIQLALGLNLHKDAISGHVFLDPTIGAGNSAYLLPDILASYKISSAFRVNIGWQALLHQNTLQQLTTENPFIYLLPGTLLSSYQVQQSRNDEVFASFDGSLGHHFVFSAKASWWSYTALPGFLNSITDQRQMYTTYEDVKATSLQASARYQVANTFSVGLSGTFYNFYSISQEHVWQQPDARIKADLMIRPIQKLTVTGYLSLLGGMYAQNNMGDAVKMNTIVDIGGNAEYSIIPRLSAFLQVNNLLDSKYQRWQGYQAYGLNIYAGLRLKF